jgi:hypothetical protein
MKLSPLKIEQYYALVYPYKDARIRQTKGGYSQIYLPEHPMSFGGWFLHHRAVVEQSIGRFLYPCEEVHHIDKDRSNNELSNLKLFATKREHLQSEHKNSKTNDKDLVAMVREAAENPKVSMSSLPCSSVTVRKICKVHDITWLRADFSHIDEEQVRKCVQKGMSTKAIADHLGVCYKTLWRNFPHILKMRKSPHSIDQYIREICDLLVNGKSERYVSKLYGYSLPTISHAIRRWSESGELSKSLVRKLNKNPYRKMKLRHMGEIV